MINSPAHNDFDYCFVLTYYSPYVSGLSNVAKDIAEGLAKSGMRVCVVTTRYEKSLPKSEYINNVRIFRASVWFRLGKGVISPSLFFLVRRISRRSRIINIHAPMLEAGLISILSCAPVVTTYQCDVSLEPTLFGKLQNFIIDLSSKIAIRYSKFVTVSSTDYSNHSRLAQNLRHKAIVIPPPCHLRKNGNPSFRDGNGIHVGFLGRIVEEKGLDYLIDGFSAIQDPSARLLIGGDFGAVAGGSIIHRIKSKIDKDKRILLLGFLPESELKNFYASIDVFALPSINSFEAFGIVQVEALMLGIPVITTDIPGVRQPVMNSKLGLIVDPRSGPQITNALMRIEAMRNNSKVGSEISIQLYNYDSVVKKFKETLDLASNAQ